MKVKATNQYEKLKIEDKELKRIPKEGEIFEVSEERFKILNGKNDYNATFVQKVEEVETRTTITTTTEEDDIDKILNSKQNKNKRK